jgi:hypothetical protein
MARPDSPYKFLDSYEESDREIFFGRERETQILLADIVVSRLVLLFAETGTGKTSLIKAGVTPLLTDRHYVTFFVRISEDPATSLCDALRGSGERLRSLGVEIRDDQLALDDDKALASQLEELAHAVKRPLVFFLDQFEEFFIYVLRRDHERAMQFVSDVGTIQRNAKSKVRIVFSMREDFVGKMDVFRDEIPAIFHRESNLRLRPFDEEQARAAITSPARARGVTIEAELESAVVDDLRGVEGIDPTELQIVCDTLWHGAADSRIDLAAYQEFGRGAPGSIAQSILTQRLEKEFEDHLSRAQLDLLAELLPRLRTRGDVRHVPTKFVRDIDGLATELDVEPAELDALLDQLTRARLIRAGTQPNLVELTHDYLVGQLDELAQHVKGIAPRSALRDAMTDSQPERLAAPALEEILAGLEHLELDATQAAFLLRAALAHGRHTQIEPLLDAAGATGLDVWGILGEQLAGEPAGALRAVDLLATLLQRPEAAELLAATVLRDDDLGARIIEVLEPKLESIEAVEIVAGALDHPSLAGRAQSALASLARSSDPDVASKAARALLERLGREQPTPEDAVSRLETYGAVEVLVRTLDDPDLESFADEALARLAASANPGVAARAAEVVTARLEAALGDPSRAAEAVDRIGRLDTLRAVDLVSRALERPHLEDRARTAMARLAQSDNEVVAARAQEALRQHQPAAREQPSARAEPPPARAEPPPAWVELRPDRGAPVDLAGIEDPHLMRVVDRMLQGRVVPFLGPGSVFASRPSEGIWERGGAYPPSARELAAYLAEDFQYPSTGSVPGLREVCEYIELRFGEKQLFETLHKFLGQDYTPSGLHRLVAALPSVLQSRGAPPPLVVTMAYDETLERAFEEQGQRYETLTYVAHGSQARTFLHRRMDGSESYVSGARSDVGLDEAVTIVLRLAGRSSGLDNGEGTYLVTSDDVADYMVGPGAALPVGIASRLRESHLLFLGFGLTDWGNRTILRRVSADEQYYRSWAVLYGPDEIERTFWNRRDVDVIDRTLDEYVGSLAVALGVAP